jgi:hypothetical protein
MKTRTFLVINAYKYPIHDEIWVMKNGKRHTGIHAWFASYRTQFVGNNAIFYFWSG